MKDVHSHILYGIDDGAHDLHESKRMLVAARDAGITHIIATPHVKRMPYDLELAARRHSEVSALAAEHGITLDLGFELHWNALIAIEEGALHRFCIQDTDHLLIEFSIGDTALPSAHDQVIYRLQRRGLHVIIAHPERYRFVQSDLDVAERWRDMGCDLQLDAICLLRAYEPRSKATARRMYRAGLYDYLASDAHCADDYARFFKALAWAKRHE